MILYRYLLLEYFKVLLLSVGSFIAILLTTRLEEIARFAAAGGQGLLMLKFAALQIPNILPIVLPVSALISSIVLVQRMSHTNEITTLRASGLHLLNIFAPILFSAAFLSCVNYGIVSEVATKSVLTSRKLQREITLINPLTILYNQHLIKHRDILLFSEKGSMTKKTAEDVTIALWNGDNKRISLIKIEDLAYEEPKIIGSNLSMLASFKPNEKDRYDNLYLENVQNADMDLGGFSLFLKRTAAKVNDDYLRMGLLMSQMDFLSKKIDDPTLELHEKNKYLQKWKTSLSEIFRRISVGLAVMTLTLLGLSFGTTSGRNTNFKNVYSVVGLASLLIVCIFSAKTFNGNLVLVPLLYFGPHIVITALSLRHINLLSKGAEI